MDKNSKNRFSFKNSIRTEFAVIFIVVMMLTIGAFWIINSLLLQRYYILDKQDRLMKAYEAVDSLVSSSDTFSVSFRQSFQQLCSSSNLNAAIVTPGLQTVVSTTGNNNIMIIRLLEHIFDMDDPLSHGISANESAAIRGSGAAEVESFARCQKKRTVLGEALRKEVASLRAFVISQND